MERGQKVWTNKKFASKVRGYLVKEQYGFYSGTEWRAASLVITKASKNYRCADCGEIISKGELHGGPFYDHYCLNCITLDEPKREFRAC